MTFRVREDKGSLWVEGWHPDIPRVMHEKGLSRILLESWDRPGLTELLPVRDLLVELFVYPTVRDCSAVSEFRRLEKLRVRRICQIDLSRLTELRELSISGEPAGIGNIADAPKLETIRIEGCAFSDLTPFADVSRLRTLDIAETPLRSLNGIERLAHLERLNLHLLPLTRLDGLRHARKLSALYLLLRRLESVSELTALQHLKELMTNVPKTLVDIERVGELTDLESLELDGKLPRGADWLSGLTKLRELRLENVGPLPSLAFMERMSELKHVSLIENSSVANGDVSVFLRLPALTTAVYNHRRGYVPTEAEIDAALEARRQSFGQDQSH